MNIMVILKMVPDVVEELVVAADGKSLDTQWLRMKLNETDDHALEQALLLKEKYGGTVTVIALEGFEVDDVLYTAFAKGADRVLKITGEYIGIDTHTAAQIFATAAQSLPPADLILTGSQATDDLNGELAPRLAQFLGLPYLGVVTGITVDPDAKIATAIKEYGRGLRGKFQVILPAVLGIQTAEKAPRYVPVAKVRQAMKTCQIEVLPSPTIEAVPFLEVHRMYKPEIAGRAEMLEGSVEEVALRISEVLTKHGLM